MKTLSLRFSFKSNYFGVWIIAPLGTKLDGCGNYSFEQKIDCYDQRDINNTVNNFKDILQGFYDNVTSGSYFDFIREDLKKAINSDWSDSFWVTDNHNDSKFSVKFIFDDTPERTPYTFYLTEEQMDDIDSLEYTIPDYEHKNDNQMKNAIINKMITAWYNQENDKCNQRKDGSYEEQDLLDALDELTDGSYDGAAYEVIEGFIKDYFNGYI